MVTCTKMIRHFFNTFIFYWSSKFNERHGIIPATKQEINKHTCDFDLTGFPVVSQVQIPCILLWITVHISSDTFMKNSRNLFRQELTIFLATIVDAFYIKWSSCKLEWYDLTAAEPICDRNLFKKYLGWHYIPLQWHWWNKEFIKAKYQGAWQMQLVHNGYIKRLNTTPPSDYTITNDELKWSQWLESMRNDIKCTFRIIKSLWRMLKTPITLQSITIVNKVWSTRCCRLQNQLL